MTSGSEIAPGSRKHSSFETCRVGCNTALDSGQWQHRQRPGAHLREWGGTAR